MKICNKPICLLLLILSLGITKLPAQFSVGYGLGYFPTGMSSLYTEQAFFLNSSYASAEDGAVTKSRKLLPFHHGLAVGFTTGSQKENKVDFQMGWTNLHNSHHLQRTHDSTKEVTVYHKKSRVNSFQFGGKFRLNSDHFESWSLLGVMTRHTVLANNNNLGWKKTGAGKIDFGLDAGAKFKLSQGIGLYVHYTRCLFMFSAYNPSFLGAQLNINL